MKISTIAILSVISLTSAATTEGGSVATKVHTDTTLATVTSCAETVTECPGKASSAAGEVSSPGSVAPSVAPSVASSVAPSVAPSPSNATSPGISSLEGGAAINGVSGVGLAALAAGLLCL